MHRIKSSFVLAALMAVAPLVHAETYEQCVERALRSNATADALSCLRNAETVERKSFRIAYLYGVVFVRAGQLDSAIARLRHAVELRDDYVEAFQLMGAAYLQKNEPTGAIEAYENALKNERRNPTYASTIGLGRAYAFADSFKLATLWLSKASDLDRSQIDPYLELGDLYCRRHVYVLGKEQYQLALGLQPRSSPVRRRLAEAFLKSNDVDSAVAEYTTLLSYDSTDRVALTELADIHTQAKRWADARTMYHRLAALDPGDMLLKIKEGLTAFRAHQYADAIAPLSGVASSSAPDSLKIIALRLLAESYVHEKQRSLTAQTYELLLAKDSSALSAEDYKWYAGALLELGDTAKAFRSLETFTLKDTADCEICKLLGPRKMLQKDYPGAIAFFKLRLQRCDTTVSALKNIGLCYQVIDKADSAIFWYRAALAKKPYDGWTMSRMANIYMQREDRDSALLVYKDYLTHVNADSAPPAEIGDAYKYTGMIYLIKKDFTTAVEYLRKAQPFVKDDCDVTLWLAQSHHNLQQKDEACALYKEVVKRGCKNAKAAKDGLKLLECQ